MATEEQRLNQVISVQPLWRLCAGLFELSADEHHFRRLWFPSAAISRSAASIGARSTGLGL